MTNVVSSQSKFLIFFRTPYIFSARTFLIMYCIVYREMFYMIIISKTCDGKSILQVFPKYVIIPDMFV